MSLPAAERTPGHGPATASPGRWFEWRYAAAGLGWGALVGIATGVVLAMMVVLPELASTGASPFDRLTFALMAAFLGAMWGLLPGGTAGLLAGLVGAVVLPHVRGGRARWWVALALVSVVALVVAVALPAAVLDREVVGGTGVEPGAALALLPALLLGSLMARTSRDVQAQRDRLST